jgi:hypothetical protein
VDRKDIPPKWKLKEGREATFTSEKTIFSVKTYQRRQRKSLYNDKGIGLLERYHCYKFEYTNMRASKYMKRVLTKLKR